MVLLLYSTIGESISEENAINLGSLPSPPRWVDIRQRSSGLIRKEEPCFLWNGEEWEQVQGEDSIVFQFIEENILRLKLVPLSGPQLKLPLNTTSSSKSKKETTTKSNNSNKTSAGNILPSFDSKSTERVLSEVADTAKKVSSIMGATLTSWAKSASETVKVVNEVATEKRFEQIGNLKVKMGRKIAEGGFSEVYTAKGMNNELYAIKKCRAQTPEQLSQLKREIAAHETTQDAEHILKLFTSDISPMEGRGSGFSIVRFVFPLCEGGSWYDYATKSQSEEEMLRIFLGMSKGLQFLHGKSILHRDVKPHNVLLTSDHFPLLMDLGSSCPLPIKVSTKGIASLLAEEAAEQCSAPYRAPELWEPKVGKNIGGEADVWSLGCTLFAMSYGKGYSPYEDPIQGVLKLAILNGSALRFPPAKYSPFIQNVISKCVVHSNRIDLGALIDEVESNLNG